MVIRFVCIKLFYYASIKSLCCNFILRGEWWSGVGVKEGREWGAECVWESCVGGVLE